MRVEQLSQGNGEGGGWKHGIKGLPEGHNAAGPAATCSQAGTCRFQVQALPASRAGRAKATRSCAVSVFDSSIQAHELVRLYSGCIMPEDTSIAIGDR